MIKNKSSFYDQFRSRFGTISKEQVTNIELFIDMVNKHKNEFTLKQWAYVLATVYHETAATFKPVKEAFHLTENWRKNNFKYYPYYGRGYVQLTWEANYKKYQYLTGKSLVNNPDLALDPVTSFFILIHGMKNGTYTGRKISYYINDLKTDYENARRVINGTDKKILIAKYARYFQECLQEGSSGIDIPKKKINPIRFSNNFSFRDWIYNLLQIKRKI